MQKLLRKRGKIEIKNIWLLNYIGFNASMRHNKNLLSQTIQVEIDKTKYLSVSEFTKRGLN